MTENITGEFAKQLTLSNMVAVNWNWLNYIVKIFPLPTKAQNRSHLLDPLIYSLEKKNAYIHQKTIHKS